MKKKKKIKEKIHFWIRQGFHISLQSNQCLGCVIYISRCHWILVMCMFFSLSLLWSDFCVVLRQLLWHTPRLASVSLEASAKGTGPKSHFCSPGNPMHTASPACRGGRFFVPWFCCLHFNFMLAASSLAVAPESLHD